MNTGVAVFVELNSADALPVHVTVEYVSPRPTFIAVPSHTSPLSLKVIAGYSLSSTVTLTVALSVLSQPSTTWLT